MGALLFPLLWFLADLSPLAAIFLAVRFYAVHRRRRPEPDRRMPVVAYVMVLLVCAIIAFPFGFFWGISAACSGPRAGNMCWVWGSFVTGLFASSLAIVLVSGLIAALPADEPAFPPTEAAPMPANAAPSLSADETPIPANINWYRKLWRGEYSLARSFWGFFILGTLVGTIIGMNPALRVFAESGFSARLLRLSDKCWHRGMAQR